MVVVVLGTSLLQGWEMGPHWDPLATCPPTLGVLCQHVPGDADLPDNVIAAGKQEPGAGQEVRSEPPAPPGPWHAFRGHNSARMSWAEATVALLSPWSVSASLCC